MDIAPTLHTSDPQTTKCSTTVYATPENDGSSVPHKVKTTPSDASTTTKGSLGKSVCCATMQLWWHSKFALCEKLIHAHHWKVLGGFLFLGLFCLGLKLVTVDTNFDQLWVEESDRLISEWRYLANAMQRVGQHGTYPENTYYSGYDSPRSRFGMMPVGRFSGSLGVDDLDAASASSGSFGSHSSSRSGSGTFQPGLPGHEFMVTMETILQTVVNTEDHPHFGEQSSHQEFPPRLLTPSALLDHMDFLIKVRRLQVTVGASKWSFEDLCQRATLPFGAGMHHIQAYLDMIIPCSVITPLDCFWEGAKVLGPEEGRWVPWPHKFGEQTLFQWTHIDPIGLLENLRDRYQNYSGAELGNLINLFRSAGINHGYLNKTCLDPSDPACPISAPNYRGQAPNVARVLTGGCPGFAGNILHWPEEIIIGGRVHWFRNSTKIDSGQLASNLTSDKFLVSASALQSLILLRSPRDLYEAVRLNDPYKYEGWTLADAQHVLDEWRRSLRRLVLEHNLGLQPNTEWQYYAFTDNSLRDLLRELTLRLGPIKVVGCVLLVLMYGLVCLLDWRDPVRSQCWFALSGLALTVLACLAGLGICAALGLPFNVLTIQVLPFMLMGLGLDGIFMLTTCYQCCITRRTTASAKCDSQLTPWASTTSISTCSSSSTCSTSSTSLLLQSALVLAEHGPSLLFGTIAMSGAFFSAAYIPIPLMRQFCLQAGTLVLIQSASVFLVFPCLLKLDGIRRSQRRLDVLCCLQQPKANTSPDSHQRLCELSAERTASANRRDYPTFKQPDYISRSHGRKPTLLTSTTTTAACMGCSAVKRSRSRTKGSATHRLCSSIQVNVVNHVGSSNASCASCSNPVGNSRIGPHHTVHTTVTVTNSDRETPPHADVISHPTTVNQDRLGLSEPLHRPPEHIQEISTNVSNDSHHRNLQKSRCSAFAPPDPTFGRIRAPFLVRLARRFALFLTCHWTVPLFVCLSGVGLFVTAGFVGNYRLELGLDLSSLTPVDAVEYGFVKHSDLAFGLYNFQVFARGTDLPGSRPPPSSLLGLRGALPRNKDASKLSVIPSSVVDTQHRARTSRATVGRGIDFPIQQRQLLHLYNRISQLSGVMMAGRYFWLEAMRTWLEEVQTAFDIDRERGVISENGHWSSNATELGVLGLRLIIQTDRGPELRRIKTGRLVRGGIIDPPAFYVLLSAWRTYDALNFSSPAWMIHPEPSLIQTDRYRAVGRPHDLHAIPPAEPIEFVQTNFYAVGLSGMRLQLQLVRDVRFLTESATAQGVPTFPAGTPFTFTEHYLYLARESAVALGIFFGIIFTASLLLFSSPIIVLLLVLVGGGGGVCAAICGLVLLGLEVNPISSGLILFSAGLGARTAVGFLGTWSKAHGYSSFFMRLSTLHSTNGRGFCVCRYHGNHKPGCSSTTTQYCNTRHSLKSSVVPVIPVESLEKQEAYITHSSRTNSFPPSVRSSDRSVIWGSSARTHFVRSLSSQFASSLHSIVGLVVAVALLAASRVKFIADYFFSLIVVVSIICLFNATCLIPTLCHLLHPLHQYFVPVGIIQHSAGRKTTSVVGSRRFQNKFRSIDPALKDNGESSPKKTSLSASWPLSSSPPTHTLTTHFPDSLPIDKYACDERQQQPVQKASGALAHNPTIPTATLISPVTLRTTPVKLLSEYTSNQLYDLCSRQLRELANVRSRQVNTSQSGCSTASPDAAAAAAAVVMAAAAAASARSRPASLSTISEEPSHASSIVSLNHITSSGGGGIQENPGSSLNTVSSRSTVPESLGPNSIDLLDLSKLLTTHGPAINLLRQFSVFPSEFGLHDDGKRPAPGHPRDSEPEVECTLLAFGTTQKPRLTGRERLNPSPPPSYTTAVEENRNLCESHHPNISNIYPTSESAPLGHSLVNSPSVNSTSLNSFCPPLNPSAVRIQAQNPHAQSSVGQHNHPGPQHCLPSGSTVETLHLHRTSAKYANSRHHNETR
ncbi:hypothetical protein CRM22_005501 [Opisthorchis felineus]|uniref:SSD domain-containing protein n=1 Tax=Opisthorchis felineus TaxID=147828 RepID=A0A4S2LQX5_OPIFE|nr:hypothetical protein CRM22_005501 [Opisthorchis felineus]